MGFVFVLLALLLGVVVCLWLVYCTLWFWRFPGVLVEVGVVVGGLCDSVCGFWVWLHSLGCRFLVALNELLVAGFWLWFTVVLLWLLSFGVVIVDYGCLFVLWVVVLW